MTDLITRLVFEPDNQSKRKAIKSLSDVAKSSKQTEGAFKKSASSAKDYRDELNKLSRQDTGSSERIRGLNDETKAVQRQKIAFADLADERRKAAQQGGADFLGDTTAGVSGFRGGAEALGASSEITAPLAIIEGFTDIGESAKLLNAQVQTLGASAAQAIPALGGTAGGVAAIGAAAIPVVAVLAAAALAVRDYNKAAEEQRKVLESTLDAQRSVNEAVATGLTTDQAEARIAELEQLAEAEARTLSERQAAYASFEDQLGDAFGIAGGLVTAGVKAFDSREQELADSINESQGTLQGYRAEIARLNNEIEAGNLATNDATASIEELKVAELELALERDTAASELEAIAGRISGFNNQIAQQTADRYRREANDAELANLEQKFANEDELAEQQAHFDNLANIASDGRSRIESIQSDLAGLSGEQQTAIAKITSAGQAKITDIQQSGQQKIADINRDFMQKSIKEADEFAKESRRIAQDRQTTLTRLAEDGLAALRDAERANSVLDFLNAQESNAKELKRTAEDLNTEERRRAEDRSDELRRQAEEQRQRIAEVQAQIQQQTDEQLAAIEADKQATIQSFDEKRLALQESLEAEKVAIQERLDAAQAAYDAQEQREQQQEDRRAERQAIRDRQEEESFNRQIAQIEARRNAELQLLTEVQAKLADINTQVSNNLSVQNNPNSSSPNTVQTPFTKQSFSLRDSPTAFAEGGIVNRPTLALMGERGPEAIIPFKQSQGLPQGIGGQPVHINLTLNNTVGDIATRSMLEREGEAIFNAASGLLVGVIDDALAGKTA